MMELFWFVRNDAAEDAGGCPGSFPEQQHAAVMSSVQGHPVGDRRLSTAAITRPVVKRPKPGSASDPLWYKDAIIYELHVKAFNDSNGDGFGDFQGIIQKRMAFSTSSITRGLSKFKSGWCAKKRCQ